MNGTATVLAVVVVSAIVMNPSGVEKLLAQADELLPRREERVVLEQCIDLYEEALSQEPEETAIRVKLAQLWHEHAVLLRQEGKEERQQLQSLRASANYAAQALGLESYMEVEGMSVRSLEGYLAEADDPGALLWLGDSWGRILDTNRWHAFRVQAVEKFRIIYGRLLEIDESFFGAAGHRSLGAMEANLATTALVGGWLGSVEHARDHFERAIELAPHFLMNHVEYANHLARPRGEWELFDELLHHALQAPVRSKQFWNTIAQELARTLLQEERRPFPPDG